MAYPGDGTKTVLATQKRKNAETIVSSYIPNRIA